MVITEANDPNPARGEARKVLIPMITVDWARSSGEG